MEKIFEDINMDFMASQTQTVEFSPITSILKYTLCGVLLGFIGHYLKSLYDSRKTIHVTETIKGEEVTVSAKPPPGPIPWPVIGNMKELANFNGPFQAFTALSRKYGDIYSMKLGASNCVVVNDLNIIREVLNKKGKFFGGRPDFLRYHSLFGGDRNNSLALCDFTPLQQTRRNVTRRHCSPRESTSYFAQMNNVGIFEIHELMAKLKSTIVPDEEIAIKPILQLACANMFTHYMCSLRFGYEDKEFQEIVTYFDEIFWEINQGYALDFMPYLKPFYRKHMQKLSNWSTDIRKFILKRIMVERNVENVEDEEADETDFTDAIIKTLNRESNTTKDHILFMLEDFIGGHSAVGNLVMLAMLHIAKNPEIGRRIQEEVDRVMEGDKSVIDINDIPNLPYTMATVYEVLRYSSSPIVPHVATEPVIIAGYGIQTDTVVFINNYILNTSTELWSEPDQFIPDRFIEYNFPDANKVMRTPPKIRKGSNDSGVDVIEQSSFLESSQPSTPSSPQPVGQLRKSIPYFIPFSVGSRTCLGQGLVKKYGPIILANILYNYNVTAKNPDSINFIPACVALPARTHSLVLNPRQ